MIGLRIPAPKSLAVEPIQSCSRFISYSRKDKEFAKGLHRDLLGERVRRQ